MFKITRMVMVIAAMVIGSTTFSLAATSVTPATTVAQTSPKPAPTATPNPFSYRGYVRAYDFTRQNAYNGPGGTKKLNQQSFNAALSLHGDYAFGGGFTIGGTYLYANPLNGCTTAASHYTPPCGNIPYNAASTGGQQLNPDDTVPGFQMSTLYEAYLAYKSKDFSAQAGDLVINTPWANASDSRLKPNAFTGGIASYKLDKNWTIDAGLFTAFEDRASSQFFRSTLLTYNPVDAAHITQLFNQTGLGPLTMLTSNGFQYGRVGYTAKDFGANLYYYGFSDIASTLWADGKYTWSKAKLKPFIAVQGGSQSNTGKALVGQISSQILGIQGGVSLTPNIAVTLGYDDIPSHTAFVAGLACPANHEIASNKGLANYFMAPGQPNCVPAAGGATIYYGGWATPYTDSYATDPLFTTSISQGMADRRNFGQGGKLAIAFTSNDKQFNASISRALYIYGDSTVGLVNTQETNFDTQYRFSKIGKGAYHGFLLRYRYAERTQDNTAIYGGGALFKYNRFQAEYDF